MFRQLRYKILIYPKQHRVTGTNEQHYQYLTEQNAIKNFDLVC